MTETIDAIKPLATFRVAHGFTTLHLNHPAPRVMPNGNIIRDTPAKIAITSAGTVIREDMVRGTGEATLRGQQIADAIRETRAFKAGGVLDITNGDPLDPRQRERRRKEQELAEKEQLRYERDAAEAELALLKAEQGNNPSDVSRLKAKIKELRDKEFTCPFCRKWKPKATAATSSKKAGLSSHMNNCPKRPSTDEEAAAAREKAERASPKLPSAATTPALRGDPDPALEHTNK